MSDDDDDDDGRKPSATKLKGDPITASGLTGATIGGTYKQALATFGQPSHETKGPRQTKAIWRKRGLVMTVAKSKIEKITLWYSERWFRHNEHIEKRLAVGSPPWRSDKGIGAGSTPAQTLKAHGKAPHVGGYKDGTGRHDWVTYETIGFHFFNGVLARVDVFRP